MKKGSMFMIGIAICLMLLSACGQSQNEVNTVAPVYKVSESTGLYSALAIDADQIAVLPAGALLIPANGNTTLFCDTFVDTGIKYALCEVEDLDTGQSGWVLKMFIEKN